VTRPESSTALGEDVVVLDVRHLQPRDRHKTIFGTLGGLDAGETLHLVNDHDPAPLRYQLEAEYPDHYYWVTVEAGPERWTVDITFRARVVDARPILAVGDEPFERIMQAAAATGDDKVLVVYDPWSRYRCREYSQNRDSTMSPNSSVTTPGGSGPKGHD